MQDLNRPQQMPLTHAGSGVRATSGFLQAVFSWMAIGLALTGVVAWFTAGNRALLDLIFGNRLLFYGLILGELGMVVALSAAIRRLSYAAAGAMFLVYSGLNGLTLASIFLIYTTASVAGVFFITAGTFGAVAFYGATTKRDLSSMGALAFMGLIGIILASVVNMFLHSSGLMLLISYVGVAVFVGLTAYDMQKLRALHESGTMEGESGAKLAVLGALSLYLDFVNLFLMLLRIFGNRR
jgi:hypothetical protein